MVVSNFLMKALFVLTLASVAQMAAAQPAVVLSIPAGVEPRSCEVMSSLQGAFGGVAKPERLGSKSRSFEISTVKDGVAGRSLKVWLSCRGFEVVLLDFPTLREAAPVMTPNLRRVSTLGFRGIVTGLDRPTDGLEVEVNYYPWWRCAFFGMPDCGMGGHFVVAMPLSTDGRFRTQLPSYLHQPEIRAFETHRGEFQFLLRSRSNRSVLYRLNPSPSPSGRVREQDAYPEQQIFTAVPVK